MDVEICIIGAGVIGLAIARKLSESHKNVFILEKNNKFGQETSSRNSEVIHSGIYYTPGSLKAKLCVEGNDLLYEYAAKKSIPFLKCGKLIVSTDEKENKQLLNLLENGKSNGLSGIELIEAAGVHKLEPNICALQALHLPQTGIIDSHLLMQHLLGDAILNGCEISYLSNVIGIKKIYNGYLISIEDEKGQFYSFTSSTIINCAGLESYNISKLAGLDDPSYQLSYCKGEYFRVRPPKNKMLSRLIYPLPPQGHEGLGVHATLELDGGLKLGPNAIYLDQNVYDYSVEARNNQAFYNSAKKYLPFLELEDLSPEMAGIRPKLQAKGEATKDFVIKNEYEKGFLNFINLIGIESPGLTASMAIAKYTESIIL